MSNNLISDIQPGAFTNMTRLVRLILSKNKITKLDQNSLSGKTKTLVLGKYLTTSLSRCLQSGGVGALEQLHGGHPHRGSLLPEEPQVSQFGFQQNPGERKCCLHWNGWRNRPGRRHVNTLNSCERLRTTRHTTFTKLATNIGNSDQTLQIGSFTTF